MRNNCSQVVVENFFEPCVLYLLMKKSSYGYNLQKELREKCHHEVNIGNLYRCLLRMNKQGYVKREESKSEIGPKRYSYSITSKGKMHLKTWIEALEKQQKITDLLIKNYQKHL